jgi:uncharacterized protein
VRRPRQRLSDHIVTREVREDGSKGVSPTLVIADHTGVPNAFRGTGAGLAMVARLVADARAEGFKVMPLCPFVNAMRQKHPEWADVFSV